jgi:hypothetical protein
MPFRDPDEVLRARVAALEEALDQQRREVEGLARDRDALKKRLDEMLSTLGKLREATQPATRGEDAAPKIAEAEESQRAREQETKAPADPAPPAGEPPRGDDGTKRGPRLWPLITLAAVVTLSFLAFKKWWPKEVMPVELAGARLLTPEETVKGAVENAELGARHRLAWPQARALVAEEPATCSYYFLAPEERLSAVDCSIAVLPDKDDNDAMVDRVIAHFEGQLGWPTSSDETDYGSWRRVGYRWSGSDASLEVSMQSPASLLVTLKLDTHDDTAAAARQREAEAQHKDAVEAARKRREEERRELSPSAP